MLHEMISQYLNNEYNFKPIQLVIVEHLGPYHAESLDCSRSQIRALVQAT